MEEVKEEGPKEMTLDEWKAMQNKKRAKVEFNIRKPNEGDEGQWKKGYVLHKSKSKDQAVSDTANKPPSGARRLTAHRYSRCVCVCVFHLFLCVCSPEAIWNSD